MIKKKTKTTRRILIDDNNSRKIAGFISQRWSIMEVGFEGRTPVYRTGEESINESFGEDLV